AQDTLLEDLQVRVLGDHLLEFGTTQTVRQAGGEDDRAALLDDGQSAGQSLDGLVPGRIEGVACTAGDHDVERFSYRHLDHAFDEAHPVFPGFDHVAGPDPGDTALAVEADVDDEIAAGHQG